MHVITAAPFLRGARASALMSRKDAESLEPNHSREDWDAFWYGWERGIDAVQRGRWVTLGSEAFKAGVHHDEAADLLVTLESCRDDCESFWKGWRCAEFLANPAAMEEMRRLKAGG